jgi:hypothetical protein
VNHRRLRRTSISIVFVSLFGVITQAQHSSLASAQSSSSQGPSSDPKYDRNAGKPYEGEEFIPKTPTKAPDASTPARKMSGSRPPDFDVSGQPKNRKSLTKTQRRALRAKQKDPETSTKAARTVRSRPRSTEAVSLNAGVADGVAMAVAPPVGPSGPALVLPGDSAVTASDANGQAVATGRNGKVRKQSKLSKGKKRKLNLVADDDTVPVVLAETPLGLVANVSGGAKVVLADANDPDGAVRLESASGESVGLRPLRAGKTKAARVAKGARWAGVVDGNDLEETPVANGVKGDIILAKPSVKDPVWDFELVLTDGLIPTMGDGETVPADARPIGTPIRVRNAAGSVVAEIPAGFAFDANGSSSLVDIALRQANDDRWLVSVAVDKDWLNAADRAFPVRVDPTIVRQVTSGSLSTVIENGAGSAGSFPLMISDQYYGFSTRYAYAKFDTTGLGGSAGVGSAFLKVTVQNCDAPNAWGPYAFPVKIAPTTSAWDAATVSWATKPAVGPEQSATAAPGVTLSFDVTSDVAWWANGNGTPGFQLRMDRYAWAGQPNYCYLSAVSLEVNSAPVNRPAVGSYATPTAGQVGVGITPTLTLNGSDPDGNTVYYYQELTTSTGVAYWNGGWTTNRDWTTPTLPMGVDVTWRGWVWDGISATSTWLGTSTFNTMTTVNGAPTVTQVSPANGATAVGTNGPTGVSVQLQASGTDPNPQDTLEYQFVVLDNGVPFATRTWAVANTYSFIAPFGANLRWVVSARDVRPAGAGPSIEVLSPVRSFTTNTRGNSGPSVPTQYSPANGIIGENQSVVLAAYSTDPENDAIMYNYTACQVGTSSCFSSGFIYGNYTTPTLPWRQQFTWSVVARDVPPAQFGAGIQSGVSSSWTFTVKKDPARLTVLESGEILPPNGFIKAGYSLTGVGHSYELWMQGDGNLVSYFIDPGYQQYLNGFPCCLVMEESRTRNNHGGYLHMRPDGILVLYSAAGQPMWQMGAAQNPGPGAFFVFGTYGQLIIYRANGVPAYWEDWGIHRSGAYPDGPMGNFGQAPGVILVTQTTTATIPALPPKQGRLFNGALTAIKSPSLTSCIVQSAGGWVTVAGDSRNCSLFFPEIGGPNAGYQMKNKQDVSQCLDGSLAWSNCTTLAMSWDDRDPVVGRSAYPDANNSFPIWFRPGNGTPQCLTRSSETIGANVSVQDCGNVAPNQLWTDPQIVNNFAIPPNTPRLTEKTDQIGIGEFYDYSPALSGRRMVWCSGVGGTDTLVSFDAQYDLPGGAIFSNHLYSAPGNVPNEFVRANPSVAIDPSNAKTRRSANYLACDPFPVKTDTGWDVYFTRGEEGGGPDKIGASNTIWRVKMNQYGSFLPDTAQEVMRTDCVTGSYAVADYGCGQPSVARLNDGRQIIVYRKPGPPYFDAAKGRNVYPSVNRFHYLNANGSIGTVIGQTPTGAGPEEDGASPELFAVRGDTKYLYKLQGGAGRVVVRRFEFQSNGNLKRDFDLEPTTQSAANPVPVALSPRGFSHVTSSDGQIGVVRASDGLVEPGVVSFYDANAQLSPVSPSDTFLTSRTIVIPPPPPTTVP